uniref:Uncharacterized protein n=1 Tax=Pipistrellus kuhlii TaxID=59472 RepID=A0A7J7W3U3_PIPKU|nr:hypothetical protein mPipKuh1_008166 [Pipistrellus kuhlii]
MQPFPDRNLTPRDAHPDSGHPKPLLPCPTWCVFPRSASVRKRVPCARAIPRAPQASSYPDSRQDQSLGVSLETNQAIPEGRMTNHNGSVGSVKGWLRSLWGHLQAWSVNPSSHLRLSEAVFSAVI